VRSQRCGKAANSGGTAKNAKRFFADIIKSFTNSFIGSYAI
jgi:hypothetical protein